MLSESGMPIMSYGQLPFAARQNISEFLRSEFGAAVDTTTAAAAAGGKEEEEEDEDEETSAGPGGDELAEFVKFVKKSNGKIYKEDPKLHRQLLLLVGLSKQWAVVDPAEIAKHVQHRFLGIPWVRAVDLVTVDDSGAETVLRPTGVDELTRFRKNKVCKAPSSPVLPLEFCLRECRSFNFLAVLPSVLSVLEVRVLRGPRPRHLDRRRSDLAGEPPDELVGHGRRWEARELVLLRF
eukprot:SAG22_NODE_940_length_6402_cov_34.673172_5_plen_237_part_00